VRSLQGSQGHACLEPKRSPLLTSRGAGRSLRWHDLGTEGWGSAAHVVPLPLPTLAGWLLEYPVVYLFDPQHGASAARNLSCCSLLVHRVVSSASW
jgi:hypothetical protein